MVVVPAPLPKNGLLRIVLRLIGGLAVFGLGITLGYRTAWQHAKYMPDVYAAADSDLLRLYLVAQSTKGTAAQHEKALRLYLVMLKRQEANHKSIFGKDVGGFQEMVSYLKLSELARVRGDENVASGYLTSAQELCRQRVQLRNCSTEEMTTFMARLEQERRKRYLD
jgi:hypothetical protein